jgi:hypothetical protein
MEDALIIILIIGVVIAILGMSFYLSRRRTKAIEALATELGFSFVGRDRHSGPIFKRSRMTTCGN